MLHTRVLPAFLVLASAALAADPPLSVQLLDGKSLTGEWVGINERDVMLKVEGKQIARPLERLAQEADAIGRQGCSQVAVTQPHPQASAI